MQYKRTDVLGVLINRINSFTEGYRQNIAIIGEPCIGKTSLIKDLLSSNEIKKDSIIPIYIEIKIEPFEFCAKRFVKSALFHLLQSDPLIAKPHDTVLLIEDLKRDYPKTAQTCIRVLQDIEKGKVEDAYSFMLDISAAIFEESKRKCVLIIDEFHNLENFILKNPFGLLAKKIMIQKDTMYFLLSSRNTISQRLLNEKLSMLFGNFEKIVLPPFDVNMARAFLQQNIYGTAFSLEYLDFIASFTGNRPLYMKIICDEFQKAISSKKVSPDDYLKLIEYAFIETIFKKNGAINQHFSGFFFRLSGGKSLSKIAAVLIALSSENNKRQDIAVSSKLQTRDVSKILNRLIEMDVIVLNGSLYRFRDRLFGFWIKSVYLKRISSFSIDESLEEDQFRHEVTQEVNTFINEFRKELSCRIMELFNLFKNDIIQLNGRRHRFFSFSNVQKLNGNIRDSINISAANGKIKWLCTIKNDYVTENDVAEIIKNLKARRDNRINKSILVSLAGIDENAYLLAKEENIWVWDSESINVLMELYGKPHIIS